MGRGHGHEHGAHGAGREFGQEGARLIRGLRPDPTKKQRLGVKISIPNDHPLAKELLELATLLATRQKLASGIEVLRPAVPDADQKLLALLERMGVPTAQILKDLGAASPAKDPLLELGLGLVQAATAIGGGPPIDLAKIAEELSKPPPKS